MDPNQTASESSPMEQSGMESYCIVYVKKCDRRYQQTEFSNMFSAGNNIFTMVDVALLPKKLCAS